MVSLRGLSFLPMPSTDSHSEGDRQADDYDEQHPLHLNETHSIQPLEIDEENDPAHLPKFLRRHSSGRRSRSLPSFLDRRVSGLIEWSRGPEVPSIQSIKTVCLPLECVSQRILDELKRRKLQNVALAALLLLWCFSTSLGVRTSFKPALVKGYGFAKPIRCMQQAWSMNANCGLDGADCGPFANSTIAYQCHPDCASKEVFETHVVGDKEVIYTSLVVGGTRDAALEPVYRADSSICQAAVHAGVLRNGDGGVVLMRLIGSHADFPATFSNGIQSVAFDSEFPKAFTFQSLDPAKRPQDFRWLMLVISVSFTSTVSIFVRSSSVFFAAVFTMMFVHVALISDRPELPMLTALVSTLAGRFLPAAFIATVLYTYCVRPQLDELAAPLERTVLWLGAAWFGALENYTLDHLPIRRLTPHDLKTQPGAVLTLFVIVLIIIAVAAGQIYYLRLEGRFRRYIKLYACMAGGLVLLAVIPSLHLRIHHYILALLLLPGTAIQTRPSLLYQGLLIGLFINGVGRWGLASILQTEEAIRGDDGKHSSPLPIVTITSSPTATAIDFDWQLPNSPYDGISVLINDVERYRWYMGQPSSNFTWNRELSQRRRTYFRFAYRTDGHAVDYTKAGIWEIDGRWTDFVGD